MRPGPASAFAYVLTGPRSFELRQFDLPALPTDWVRVRFLYCGICGSDVSKFEGRRDISYPASLGHEFVAEVVATGGDGGGLSPGDLVTSDLNYRCGHCDQCRAKRSHLCREGQVGRFTNRGFSTLGDLHAPYLVPVGSGSSSRLALAEPLSCVLHAKAWANLRPQDRVLVLGAGGLGACMAFALSLEGIPFDLVDPIGSRVARIQAGAGAGMRGGDTPDGEYDVVFDLSGSESGLRDACAHTRAGGRLCSMSHLGGYTSADFLLAALTRHDITFTVSYLNGELDSLRAAAAMLERQWSAPWDGVIEVVPCSELPRAFDERREAPWCKTLIEIRPATI